MFPTLWIEGTPGLFGCIFRLRHSFLGSCFTWSPFIVIVWLYLQAQTVFSGILLVSVSIMEYVLLASSGSDFLFWDLASVGVNHGVRAACVVGVRAGLQRWPRQKHNVVKRLTGSFGLTDSFSWQDCICDILQANWEKTWLTSCWNVSVLHKKGLIQSRFQRSAKKRNRAKPSWGKKESRAMPSWKGEVLAVSAGPSIIKCRCQAS